MDLACKRSEFSLPETEHYLNCAYMSPLSKRVEAAGIAGIRQKATPYEVQSSDFFTNCDRVRDLFSQLIGCDDATRIAIVPSASYGFAQVARNTAVAAGQKIVIVAEEFPSNYYIWRRLCEERGARLEVVAPPDLGSRRASSWNEAILEAIDADTALVTLGHVAWTDGSLFDLERIGERARAVGAAFAVDGSQSVGAMPFDVKRIRPDALICPTYKWLLGPYSAGMVYFGTRYDNGTPIEENWIIREGREDFTRLANYTDAYQPGAGRYDAGETSNFILMPMVVAALEQLLEWEPARVAAYGRALTHDLVGKLRHHGYGVAEDRWRAGHLFGFRIPGEVDPEALRDRLLSQRVHVSVRGDAVRISTHVYNDASDIQALERALLD